MPYIKTRTNSGISNEQELEIKRRLGEAIVNLGKSEQWLMVDFDDNCKLYFQGNNEDKIAYVEVKLYGNGSSSQYNSMTNEITNILGEVLGIDKNKVYVSYYPTDNWGWNGNNF